MQQIRGLSALESLDEGGGPQRPGDVQRRLQHHLGEVEDIAQGAGFGHPDAADVEVEVEVGIDHPARRSGGQGRHDHLLAEAQHPAGSVLEAGPVLLEVGRTIEDLHRQDSRAGAGIGLAAVHQQVESAQFGRQAGRVHRAAHRHASPLLVPVEL